MWPFTRKQQEIRADTEQMADIETATAEGQLLRAAVEARGEITIDKALMVPAVAACVRLITETVSMVPFRLQLAAWFHWVVHPSPYRSTPPCLRQ